MESFVDLFTMSFSQTVPIPSRLLILKLLRQLAEPLTWPSCTARRLQILRDGFDSWLEPITLAKFSGGCLFQGCKLILQSISFAVEFLDEYKFGNNSRYLSIIIGCTN